MDTAETIVKHTLDWGTSIAHRVRFLEQMMAQERELERGLADQHDSILSRREIQWFTKVIRRSIALECRTLSEVSSDSKSLSMFIAYINKNIDHYTFESIGRIRQSEEPASFRDLWKMNAKRLRIISSDFDTVIVTDYVDSTIAHVLDYQERIAKGMVQMPMGGNIRAVADSLVRTMRIIWRIFSGREWVSDPPPIDIWMRETSHIVASSSAT